MPKIMHNHSDENVYSIIHNYPLEMFILLFMFIVFLEIFILLFMFIVLFTTIHTLKYDIN